MALPNGVPPRPCRSPEIKEAAVDDILKDVMEWLKADQAEAEGVRKLLILCADDDAYRFARNLESRFWDADADLVEILSGYDEYSATRAAVIKWVAAYGITVPFSAGDVVTYQCAEGEKTGRIVDVYPGTAQIIIQPLKPEEAIEHHFGDKGGWVIAFERARLATEPALAS
ncbi:hypothetical protein [Ancylobacter radicis]|uniref:Uncharacterized protein n=1 Tax=Ancylobacter radicis TaxID=2836179 RepID=A0ABS5R3L0_9HYPH|nr:hypothetical protein [Ancylobacter radicis]MBS9476201.1 hypothetical protein [Ancylobacter radicis]